MGLEWPGPVLTVSFIIIIIIIKRRSGINKVLIIK